MSLEERLNKRLEGGKFRLLNDKMYHGKKLKGRDLKLYHEFYGSQVEKWPVNPLDIIIGKIKKKDAESVIADIGCGEAKISTIFKNVISMDLHPTREGIVPCDIRQRIPLDDRSVDVAVCCLSLMIENIAVTTKEINRVLRMEGTWYVAEVQSRISGVNFLGKKFETFGFRVEEVDVSNSQFALFVLTKVSEKMPSKLPKIKLKPCVYKKR